jgi:two-component system, OmpR family, sensor histidine kinase KdpD
MTWGYRAIGISNPAIVTLTFLTLVLAVGSLSTLRLAIATSVVTTACVNYFFMAPVGTWTIADPQNWAALFASLAVGLVASHLSTTARRRAEESRARRDELARLFDLTRDILLVPEGPEALEQVARVIERRFQLDGVLICVLEDGVWRQYGRPAVAREPEDRLDRRLAASRGTLEFDAVSRSYSGQDVARRTVGLERAVVPLRLGAEAVGALVIEGRPCEAGTRDAIAGVAAIAIERLRLLEERRQADIVRRSAELRSALFASVSHDLRTPLTAIAVAAANLEAPGLTDPQRGDQIAIVRQQVQRLTRLFQNIVDMARIETASVTPEREPVAAADLVEAAERLVEPALAGREIHFADHTDGVQAVLDPRLTSAALAHLLENAAQYSPSGSPVEVSASLDANELRLEVRDHGAGLALEDRARLFDRFYRGVEGVTHPFGSGLGLAITRGLLVAQGGRIWADTHPDGGAVFTMAVPAAPG